jgi:hypothetical protein
MSEKVDSIKGHQVIGKNNSMSWTLMVSDPPGKRLLYASKNYTNIYEKRPNLSYFPDVARNKD